MKKLLSIVAAVAAGVSLVSCSNDSDELTTSVTYPIPAYNLYTPVNGTGDATIGSARYNYTIRTPENTLEINVANMAAPGGTVANFTTIPVALTSLTVDVDESAREVLKFNATDATSIGAQVTNLKGVLANSTYRADDEVEVPGYPVSYPNPRLGHYGVMQYTLNGAYNVRTFWSDMTFAGTTTTTYPGMQAPYTNQNIRYRVVMKLTDPNSQNYTADVIFYKAKFAAPAPELTVVLKNLDLKFTDRGYEISGTNAVPQMLEAGALADLPRFTFDNFTLTCGGDLTQAYITYKVAGRYEGTFQGSWIYEGAY